MTFAKESIPLHHSSATPLPANTHHMTITTLPREVRTINQSIKTEAVYLATRKVGKYDGLRVLKARTYNNYGTRELHVLTIEGWLNVFEGDNLSTYGVPLELIESADQTTERETITATAEVVLGASEAMEDEADSLHADNDADRINGLKSLASDVAEFARLLMDKIYQVQTPDAAPTHYRSLTNL